MFQSIFRDVEFLHLPRSKSWKTDGSKSKILLQGDVDRTFQLEVTDANCSLVMASKYANQELFLGEEGQKRLENSKVLVCGEICRNLAISGVQKICLFGEGTSVDTMDIGCHPLLRLGDEGKPKVHAMYRALASLNETVVIEVIEGNPDIEFIRMMSVVISTSMSERELVALDEVCRQAQVPFVHASTMGICGRVFVDAGVGTSYSQSEEDMSSPFMVETITQDLPAAIAVTEEQKPALETGDFVELWGLQNMGGLHEKQQYKITVTGPYSFVLDGVDTRMSPLYAGGAYVVPVRRCEHVHSASLLEALQTPTFCVDKEEIGRANDIHSFFRAMSSCFSKECSIPFQSTAYLDPTEFLNQLQSIDELLSRRLSHGEPQAVTLHSAMQKGLVLNLPPFNAAIGSIAAHQALVVCTRTTRPLQGWLYFDTLELVSAIQCSNEKDAYSKDDYSRTSTSTQRNAFDVALAPLRPLIIGLGGVGCNILRLCAQMGVGKQQHRGSITIVDGKRVKISDTARGGLFSSGDISKPKIQAASAKIRSLYPQSNVHGVQCTIFDDPDKLPSSLMESVDIVCCAVDTVAVRLALDECAVQYKKPFLDAGVFGARGSIQDVIPYKSVQWSATRDPPESGVPGCTLSNFPYSAKHATLWARQLFDSLYYMRPMSANEYLTKKDFLRAASKNAAAYADTLEHIFAALKKSRPLSFRDCIVWARLLFEEHFHSKIMQLLFNFPEDMKTSTGTKFWSGTKRLPNPLTFDLTQPTHVEFLMSASNLQASVYGLNGSTELALYKAVLESIQIPPFVPQNDIKFSVSEKDRGPSSSATKEDVAILLSAIPKASEMAGYRLNCISFDQCCEPVQGNMVYSFARSAAMLRAENYRIYPPKKSDILRTARKAIPSLETASSLAASLLCLEMCKVSNRMPLEDHRNRFFNLSLPRMISAEPVAIGNFTVQTSLGKPLTWNIWSLFDIDGTEMTLRSFLKTFEAQEGLEIEMVSYGKSLLYASFLNKQKMEERLGWRLVELIEKVSGTKLADSQTSVMFSVGCTDGEGNDIDSQLPDVRVRIR